GADLDRESLRLQARALADLAKGLRLVATDEDANVELVLPALELLEAAQDAGKGLVGRVSVPDQLALGLGELAVALPDRDPVALGEAEEVFLPVGKRGFRERVNCAVFQRLGRIGYDQALVDIERKAEPAASGAGPDRAIERKERGLRG